MNRESVSPTTRWQVKLDKADFDDLKTKESFWCVVALARVVNALRFVHTPLLHYQDDDSPAGIRVRYNSFLFNCALFYEGSIFVQKLHKHYGTMTQFQAMAAIMNSKDARELLKSNLSKLRNKLVFHFDIAEIGRQLKNLEISEPVFVSAMGTTNEQAYHELADLCALRTFSGSAFPNDKRGLEIMSDLMRRTTDVTLRFLTAAEEFIKTVLERGGWQFVRIPEPCSP